MKTTYSIGLGALIGSLAITGVWIWFFRLDLVTPLVCRNHIGKVFTSPDGSQRVVVFDRDCGPPPEEYTVVHVMRGRESLYDRDGEVFVADTGVAAAESGVSVRWEAPNQLVVRYPQTAKIYFSVTRLVEVALRYEPFK